MFELRATSPSSQSIFCPWYLIFKVSFVDLLYFLLKISNFNRYVRSSVIGTSQHSSTAEAGSVIWVGPPCWDGRSHQEIPLQDPISSSMAYFDQDSSHGNKTRVVYHHQLGLLRVTAVWFQLICSNIWSPTLFGPKRENSSNKYRRCDCILDCVDCQDVWMMWVITSLLYLGDYNKQIPARPATFRSIFWY